MQVEQTKRPWHYDRINGRHTLTAPRMVNKYMVTHVVAEFDHANGIPDDEARANALFAERACNQYEALGVVALAAGEFLLSQSKANKNALYAALEKLHSTRGVSCK